MPNSSGTWKTGEKVKEAGMYLCLNCLERGTSTEVDLEAGQIAPYCKVCDLKDNTYKLLSGKKK